MITIMRIKINNAMIIIQFMQTVTKVRYNLPKLAPRKERMKLNISMILKK